MNIKKNITLPAKKREKEKFTFISKYTELIYVLFKKEYKERNEEYKSSKSEFKDFHITQLVHGLDVIVERKKKELFNLNILSKNPKENINLLNQIYSYLMNIMESKEQNLVGIIDRYNFYLIFFFPNIPVIKFMLYNIFRNNFINVMNVFKYEDFCPILVNDNCLNLIAPFFENRESKNLVLLFIYAFLIFKYDFVFQDYYDKILPK